MNEQHRQQEDMYYMALEEKRLEEYYLLSTSGITYTDCLRICGLDPEIHIPQFDEHGERKKKVINGKELDDDLVIHADKIYDERNIAKFLSWSQEEMPIMLYGNVKRLTDKLVEWETDHRSKDICKRVRQIQGELDKERFRAFCQTAITRRIFEVKTDLVKRGKIGFQSERVEQIIRSLIKLDKEFLPKIYESINKCIRDSNELQLDKEGKMELARLIVEEIAPVVRQVFLETKGVRPQLGSGQEEAA